MTQTPDASAPKDKTAANAPTAADDGAPFGTRPRRGWGPVILWAGLLAVWVAMMAWMSITSR